MTGFSTTVPFAAGKVITAIEMKGQLFIACEHAVFMLSHTDCVLRAVQFADIKGEVQK